jgi:hypothetical protein
MMMRQVSLWDVDDVDTFGPVAGMTVGPVEQIDVREFCRRWHYTNSGGSALWNYGLYDGPTLVGVVSYNLPVREACAVVFGIDHVDKVAHMGRLVCAEDAPRNSESRLISGSLRLLASDKHFWAVLTYAAQDVGHIGYVYQATNAIYTGTSSPKPYYVDETGRRYSTKAGTYANAKRRSESAGHALVQSPGKHRYVYILGTPAQRRERRKLLKLPVLPYPKAVG